MGQLETETLPEWSTSLLTTRCKTPTLSSGTSHQRGPARISFRTRPGVIGNRRRRTPTAR